MPRRTKDEVPPLTQSLVGRTTSGAARYTREAMSMQIIRGRLALVKQLWRESHRQTAANLASDLSSKLEEPRAVQVADDEYMKGSRCSTSLDLAAS